MKDLEAASIDDVRDFFRTYYVPNNATLVLVGDFDTKEADSAGAAVSRPRAEGDAAGAARHSRRSRRRPRSGGCGSRRTGRCRRSSSRTTSPSTAHPDSYPLHIASKVLSDGQSSRIYRKLVYEKQLALAAFGGGNIIEDPNLFFAVAIVQPGQKPEEAVDALIAELDRLRNEPISEAELQQAKNQFARDYILDPRVEQGQGEPLGHAVVIHDDIKTADGEFDIFMNMTAADVQRVAQTYFTPENRLVLTIMPRGASTGGGR